MKKTLLPYALLLVFSCTLSSQVLFPRARNVTNQTPMPPSSTSLSQVWEPKAVGVLPANYNVSDISIVSEQVIWATAIDYSQATPPVPATHVIKFLKSTDGGDTWEVKDIEEAMGRVSWDIHAFDENTACITTQNLASSAGRGIFRTTDGGDTWTEVFNGNAGGVWIHFFDDQEGVCINAYYIARTTNGGATWTLVPSADIPAFLSGEGTIFSSASNAIGTFGNSVWFGTTKGRIFKTEDRGQHWAANNTGLGANSNLYTMGFIDEKNGLGIFDLPGGSDHENVVRTTDGGLTWEDIGDNDIGEVDAIPCSKTFMGGYFQRTSISTNFGNTWTEVDTMDTAGAVFLTPELGWLGHFGPIGAGPALYKWIGDPLYGRTYVNQNATGANNGRGWADAYTDLQTALAAAQAGDEIWVAEGTYKPAAPGGSPTATFLINKDLKLYGGFAGTECNLSERDIALHPAVLSGDLNGDDVDSNFTQNRGDNVLHVVQVNANITNAGLIDGFTIRNGQADGTGTNDKRGGGLLCLGKPLIRQCVFEQNYALGNGGGIAFNNTSGGFALDGCTFRDNSGNEGGGLVITSNQFTVENCTFIGNATHSGTLEAHGGGIYLTNPNPGIIRNCHFSENSSVDSGAGLFAWTNTGSSQSSLNVSNCTFENNTTPSYGAGLELAPWGDNSNYTIKNCHFQGNEANSYAAFLLYVNVNASNAKALVDSCTFSQNHATGYSGGFGLWGEGQNMSIEMNACHFVGNTAGSESGGADFLGTAGATGTVTVDSCIFENNSALYTGGLLMGNYHTGGAQVNYQLTNSTFVNNQSTDYGGAIELITDLPSKCNFLVENCLIENNTSAGNSGGIDFIPSTTETHATFRNTRFINNHCAGDGGAIGIYQYLQNLPFPANASCLFENCLFAGNTSAGAAITADSLPNLQFLNCTIAGNQGGGIRLADQSGLTLQNTILYNPGHTEYQALTSDVAFTSHGGNLIGDGSLAGQATPWDFQNTDPLFVAPGDFHLTAVSPAIDKGVDFGNLPATDLDGNARVVGCPDIGAFENAVVVSTDCVVGTGKAAVAVLLAISPNPATSFLNIQLPEAITGQFDVEVFDAQGKLLRRQSLAAGQTLDVQGLAAGIYALKAVAGERAYVGKFVKQ